MQHCSVHDALPLDEEEIFLAESELEPNLQLQPQSHVQPQPQPHADQQDVIEVSASETSPELAQPEDPDDALWQDPSEGIIAGFQRSYNEQEKEFGMRAFSESRVDAEFQYELESAMFAGIEISDDVRAEIGLPPITGSADVNDDFDIDSLL